MTLTGALLSLGAGVLAALVAGAASGIWIGGASLGMELAASVGSFFGGIAGTLAVVLGLSALALLR